MNLRLSCLAGVALGFALAAPAFGEVRDLRVRHVGDRAVVEVVFDRPASAVRAAAAPSGVRIEVDGASGRARTWTPAARGLVLGLRVTPRDGGLDLDLDLSRPVVDAQARLVGASLVIETVLDAGAAAPLVAADAGPPSGREAGHAPASIDIATALDPSSDLAGAVGRAPEAELHASTDAAGHDPGALNTPEPDAHVSEPHTEPPTAAQEHASDAPEADHAAADHADADRPDADRPDADKPDAGPDPQPDLGADSALAAAAPPAAASEPVFDDEAVFAQDGPMRRFIGDISQQECSAADDAVRADPWDLERLETHGACLALLGRAEEAVEVFERLLTFEPDDPEVHLALGAAREQSGDLTGARLHYDDALRRAVTDADAARARMLLDASGLAAD